MPIRIATPGGEILITRTRGHSVRVEIHADGAQMADHVGTIGNIDSRAQSLSVDLIHEDRTPEQDDVDAG